MLTDPTDGKPGLRIETAASVIARNFMADHLKQFRHVLLRDRAAGQTVALEYANGLAGTMALVIAGGHGSKEEVLHQMMQKLREYVDRDLQYLRKT